MNRSTRLVIAAQCLLFNYLIRLSFCCGPGLVERGGECQDDNECLNTTHCSQHCTNMNAGSYQCFCYPGFFIKSDEASCQIAENEPPAKLLVSSANSIYSLELRHNRAKKPELLVQTNSDIVSFTADIENDDIYFIESVTETHDTHGLWKYNLKTKTKTRKSPPESKFTSKTRISYDWITEKIYLTVDHRILVANKSDGLLQFQNDFYITPLNQYLSDIELDPIRRLMYVSEGGVKPCVKVLNVDSKKELYHQDILKGEYTHPKLRATADIFEQSVFIVNTDWGLDQCTFGSELRCSTLMSNSNLSTNIRPFGSYIFYFEDHANSTVLKSCSRKSCSDTVSVLSLDYIADNTFLWHHTTQPNPKDHADCSYCEYGCVIKDTWFAQCTCPEGFQLSEDGKSCIDINECDSSHPPCTHNCYNTIGGFTCTCPEESHWLLDDGITCVELKDECGASHGCSHECIRDKQGHQYCLCPVGSTLSPNQKTCTGCSSVDNGNCSQLCLVQGISDFSCSCYSGYSLASDKRTCVLETEQLQVITASRKDLRILNLSNMEASAHRLPISGVDAFAYHQTQRYIYYLRSLNKKIGRISLETLDEHTVRYYHTYDFTSLALDWKYGYLYLAEGPAGKLYRMSIESPESKLVEISLDGLTGVSDLNLDIDTGYLYFAAGEEGARRIWKKNLIEVSLPAKQVSTVQESLDSIAIDYEEEYLYFTNNIQAEISALELDHLTVTKSTTKNDIARVRQLQVVGDTIYCVDIDKPWKILMFDKKTGKKIGNLSKGKKRLIGNVNLLMVIHKTTALNHQRPVFGVCSLNNGGCQHKCTEFEKSVRCSCFDGYSPDPMNAKSCIDQGAREAYDRQQELLEKNYIVVSMETCRRKNLECHLHAQCVERVDGLLKCQCLENLEGDGYTTCREVEPQCSEADKQITKCGKGGTCKKVIIGGKTELSCDCNIEMNGGFGGPNCYDYVGKRAKWKSEAKPGARVSNVMHVSMLCIAAVVICIVAISSLLVRRLRRQRMLDREMSYLQATPFIPQTEDAETGSPSTEFPVQPPLPEHQLLPTS